jgi:hypothetical protein
MENLFSKKTKSILATISLILLIAGIVTYIKNEQERAENIKNELKEKEIKLAAFHEECEILKDLIQEAIVVKFDRIENGMIYFDIKNNTNVDVKFVRFDVVFRDAFGENLQYEPHRFTYTAISLDDVIKGNSSIGVAYNFRELSRNVTFDLYKYMNNLTFYIETNRFKLTDGEMITFNWGLGLNDKDLKFHSGPSDQIAELKLFLNKK